MWNIIWRTWLKVLGVMALLCDDQKKLQAPFLIEKLAGLHQQFQSYKLHTKTHSTKTHSKNLEVAQTSIIWSNSLLRT